MHVDEPSAAAYAPAPQSEHEATFDAVEYLPAAHWLHVVAPALGPVFVTDPAPQSMQDATFDASEYLPAPHAVHFVALAAVPVSVIDPAAHSEQYLRPVMLAYLPAEHSMHAAAKLDSPAASPYRPFVQPMHADAAAEPLVVTYLPAAHAMQSEAALEPIAATYLPAAHAMHVAPLGPVNPGRQAQQSNESLPAGALDPVGHEEHEEDPVAS